MQIAEGFWIPHSASVHNVAMRWFAHLTHSGNTVEVSSGNHGAVGLDAAPGVANCAAAHELDISVIENTHKTQCNALGIEWCHLTI